MIERHIKAILFDGNGVIYYRKGGNTHSLLAEILAEAGHSVRLEGIKDPSWKKVEHAAFTGRISKWAYWDSLLQRLGVRDPEERERFSARLAEAVAQIHLNARMYLTALDRMGHEPAKAAFVGHSRRELAGARRVGLLSLAFRPDEGAKGDYVIHQLVELLSCSP